MSDEMPVGPDPVVRTALRLLPVPPHDEDFWDQLDRRLAATAPARRRLVPLQPQDAADSAPSAAERTSTAATLDAAELRSVVPPALRRRSNAALLMAAAAAAAIVVIAGSALVRQRDGTDLDTSEAAQPGADTLQISTTTAPPATADAADVDASSAVVLRWVAALGQSDSEAAWDALGPASKERLGSRTSLEDQLSALSEGYGAWSAITPDQVLVTPIGSDGDGTLVIVTLVGDITPEGTAERRADAFPVRVADGIAHIEPFADAGPIELVVPEVGTVAPGGSGPLVEGDELVVVVPDGAEAPILRLDDGAPVVCGEAPGTALTPLDGLPGRRCSFTPQGGLPPGPRLLTVALLARDGGGISAVSVLFSAA